MTSQLDNTFLGPVLRQMVRDRLRLHGVYLSKHHGETHEYLDENEVEGPVTLCTQCGVPFTFRDIEGRGTVRVYKWSLLAISYVDPDEPESPGCSTDDMTIKHLCDCCFDGWHDECDSLGLLDDSRGEIAYLVAQAVDVLSRIPISSELIAAQRKVHKCTQDRAGLEEAREAVRAIVPDDHSVSKRGRAISLLDEAWEVAPAY